MIDAHCHLGAYANPLEVAETIERQRHFTIAVTNSPSDFERALPHLRSFRFIRVAVGLHPLLGDRHVKERRRFEKALSRTSYVGEIGLDFSQQGNGTRDEQMKSFRCVLELLKENPKFVSLHSRRAESATLDLLEEFDLSGAVFHWFGGPLSQLDRLVERGHACSVNVSMIRSFRGRAIIERLPPERVLTETDGPHIAVGDRTILPGEVDDVIAYLASVWTIPHEEVLLQIRQNLRSFVPQSDGGSRMLS